MLASWMAYASLVSIALAISGLALERFAAAKRVPLRWIWAVVLTASLAWPAATAAWRMIPKTQAQATTLLPFTIVVRPIEAFAPQPGDVNRASELDRWLGIGWCAISAALLFRVLCTMLRIHRRRRVWRHEHVDGVAVRVSTADGPAVVGFRPMEVVLPEWILSLDGPLRAIVLCHEEEHRAAGDPYLLFAAAIATALLPWNPVLWLAGRRLRLAVEMDCDARVLRAHPSTERYGLLMLTVAQRRSATPLLLAPMLSPQPTHLERRILAMHTNRRAARRSPIAAAIVPVAALALACSLQTGSPGAPTPAASSMSALGSGQTDPSFDAWMSSRGYRTWTAAHPASGNTGPQYPDRLRQDRIGGSVLAQVVVDTSGLADMTSFSVLESTNEQFTASARTTLAAMRFVAAEIDGRKVKQLIQVPFDFYAGANFSQTTGDSAHRTVPCQQGNACPVHRLQPVVSVVSGGPPRA